MFYVLLAAAPGRLVSQTPTAPWLGQNDLGDRWYLDLRITSDTEYSTRVEVVLAYCVKPWILCSAKGSCSCMYMSVMSRMSVWNHGYRTESR